MWLHHDSSWWALVLAILALVLMLPLNLFANLVTPILKSWWAERSAAATRKRIAALEKQLSDYELKELSEAEDYILRSTEVLSMLFSFCISMIAVVLLILVGYLMPTVSPHDKAPIVALAVISTFSSFVIGILTFGRISRFRLRRSPSYRKTLRNNVEQLKGRLAPLR
jgi:hypothetical protein